MESNSSRDEDHRLALHLIESLREDKEGQALLKQLKLNPSNDASIDRALRNRLQRNFSTEISGGEVDNIVNIAKTHVVQFLSPKLEPEKVEPQNIPPSDVEFIGRELELETLHQQLKQKSRVVVYSEENSPGKTELARQYALLAWKKQIYPGGICWLEGKEANLGQKIVNFAKSRLGLQPPEDTDLQSQIDYCWSYWLEGDVLVILDDISDYQQVKSYLPPPRSEQRFKLLITTPQPSLEQSFSDESFEPLFLSRTTNELKKIFGDDSEGENFPYILLVTIIFFVICSGLSLIISYVTCDSEPWLTTYKNYGWIIEFIRTVIFALAKIYIVFIVFRQEFNEFFGFENTVPEYRKTRHVIRIIMLAIAVAVIIIVPHYHLVEAPKKLADSWNEDHPNMYLELDSKDGFAAYNLPYLWYLTYSLINYIVFWVPIVSVTIYAATKDYNFLNIYQKEIRDKQIKIARLKQDYFGFFDKNSICQKVALNFTDFSRIFVNKVGNYTSVFLGINIGIAFEVTVGSQTLAKAAIFWVGVCYFVWTVALVIILLAYRYYEKSLQESGNLLLEINCANLDNFQDKNSVIMFIRRVFNNYFNLYLGLFLTTMILIWAFVN